MDTQTAGIWVYRCGGIDFIGRNSGCEPGVCVGRQFVPGEAVGFRKLYRDGEDVEDVLAEDEPPTGCDSRAEGETCRWISPGAALKDRDAKAWRAPRPQISNFSTQA